MPNESGQVYATNSLIHILPTELANSMADIIPIVEKAVSHGGRGLYGITYDGIKTLFERLDSKVATNLDDVVLPTAALVPAIFNVAQRLLFNDLDLSIESTRNKRAYAALAFTAVCGTGKLAVPDGVRRTVKTWQASERSGQVQTTLRRVSENIDKLATQL